MTNIAICGSMTFAKEMIETKITLDKNGFNIFTPKGIKNGLKSFIEADASLTATKSKIQNNYIRSHYEFIKKSEAVLILNYDKNGINNYIGGNSLMEMGFAFTLNRDIFLLNPIPNISYKSEIEAMSPIVLNGNLDLINEYYKTLSTVYVSSESVIKTSAVSFALREFNYRFNVVGIKAVSDISEQPNTIDETYLGAINRLKDLKVKIKNKAFKMLVSVESGNAFLHKNHNMFGLSVCIVEDEKGKKGISIGTDLEIPKKMTDLVPSKYPDLGVLVQQKYGIENKDPYVYFTSGKLNRERLIINSVVNALSLL